MKRDAWWATWWSIGLQRAPHDLATKQQQIQIASTLTRGYQGILK